VVVFLFIECTIAAANIVSVYQRDAVTDFRRGSAPDPARQLTALSRPLRVWGCCKLGAGSAYSREKEGPMVLQCL